MKRVLITGISGFVGYFLAKHLQTSGNFEILGTIHSDESRKKITDLPSDINLKQLDITQVQPVTDVIFDFKPDYIYHLAAQTSPSDSFQNPSEFLSNNIISQVNILEAVRKNDKKDTKVLVVSSGEIYGKLKQEDLPLSETTPLRPTSPYAVSKIAQDYLGLQYYLSYGLHTIRVRPFNHIGPRQDPRLVVPAFAKQIAEIEKGKKEPILLVGNLNAERDFTDVRDIVRAYALLMEKGIAGEVYNIGSGVSLKIEDILHKLLSLSAVEVTVKTDESKLRPSDIPQISVNCDKLTSFTGWQPEIPIEQTLKDTLDYWREIV
jgi:GDP-4-dehydro-6-deoxy-D-mannose reductase